MSLRALSLSLGVLVCIALSSNVSAQEVGVRPGTVYYDYASPEPCGAIDADRACYALGPSSGYCKAYRSMGSECSICGKNIYGKRICVTITMSASCECKDERVPGTGPGITECSEGGQCTYVG